MATSHPRAHRLCPRQPEDGERENINKPHKVELYGINWIALIWSNKLLEINVKISKLQSAQEWWNSELENV